MTTRSTQAFRRSLVAGAGARTTLAFRRTMASLNADLRTTQAFRRLLAEPYPDTRTTQAFRRALAVGLPCVTETCQIWKIARRDGLVFRYTSHDQDVEWMGYTFKRCDSLQDSATQSSAELGKAGDFTLQGVISDESISEADLYGGLYDDAYVECWKIDWGGTGALPKRLIAGWTGNVSHGEKGLRMTVRGPSHRLDQNAITRVIAPACRFVFGSTECGVDREALLVAGSVAAVTDRGKFSGTFVSGGSLDQYWPNGLLRWVTGANAGQLLEIKDVAVNSSAIDVTLWALAPLLIAAGDTFEILPGCDKSFDGDDGCAGYANKARFGGYPHVPGADALTDTPNAKY